MYIIEAVKNCSVSLSQHYSHDDANSFCGASSNTRKCLFRTSCYITMNNKNLIESFPPPLFEMTDNRQLPIVEKLYS